MFDTFIFDSDKNDDDEENHLQDEKFVLVVDIWQKLE